MLYTVHAYTSTKIIKANINVFKKKINEKVSFILRNKGLDLYWGCHSHLYCLLCFVIASRYCFRWLCKVVMLQSFSVSSITDILWDCSFHETALFCSCRTSGLIADDYFLSVITCSSQQDFMLRWAKF